MKITIILKCHFFPEIMTFIELVYLKKGEKKLKKKLKANRFKTIRSIL